jgi:hypothetical protein
MKVWLMALLAGSFALSGCGAAMKVNPKATFPLPVADDKPAFLFPINISHAGCPGDPNVIGVSVTGQIAGKFGKKVISGQQLFDLVGNLSFELAEQIKAATDAGHWDMTGGAERVASDLSQKMEDILKKLSELGLLPPGYKFQYIIALHSHGGPGMVPKTVNVNSWGGIYDVSTKEILDYIDSTDTIAAEQAAVLVTLPMAYNGIIQKLINGKT